MRIPKQAIPIARGSSARHTAASINPADACLTVSYNNGKICADFPIIGQQCVSIPGLPSGSGSAQACLSYVFPDCAKICVSIAGIQIGCVTQCIT